MVRKTQPKTLPPVHPNAGTIALYRKKLDALIKEMNNSVDYWVSASFKKNEPVIAQDALPSVALRRAVRKLARRWQKQFDDAAPKLAEYFSQSANMRSSRVLQNALREGGFTVKFKMTRAMRDVMNATISEQVGLIRSIPQKYFTEIEGAVMRSVSQGGDLYSLSKTLHEQYGVTKRRAAFIARDQTSKSTASFTRVRQLEIGITEAIWVHSGGGKTQRPTHVSAGARKQRYKVSDGWYDPAVEDFIQPGFLPNCRCVSRSIIPGIHT